ncbi:hypothetical protein [Saccharicrinis aurantiacus]|uniref:hypothetical protein n=1 Tax=Saccharicrinis aurantiacus TaxID=1849719 RepID=UPI002490653B|nr:hypothetical protein [Saccharicrinis aurantiacus]
MEQFTKIKSFDINNETCFVCGRKAKTREHIFPKWLQHKFNLWDQKLVLPNQTKISYKQLVVPCCSKCNGKVFGRIEKVISSESETDSDIWRWANKIHFCLTIKDKIFEWDRKNSGYKIGDVISPKDPLEEARHYLHCVSGDFKCSPDPFGSVFKFTFKQEQVFNFIHIINSSSIFISLGNRGYIVFIKDCQFFKDHKGIMEEYKELKLRDLTMSDVLYFYAKNIEYISRTTVIKPFIIKKGEIVKIGRTSIGKTEEENTDLLKAICNQFGINLIIPD